MSTNSECEFFEAEPGKWFYVLEHYDAPKNAWDWRENADCYGPFNSYTGAHAHLCANRPNPGGHMVTHHDGFKPDDQYRKLIAGAQS